MEEPLLKQRTKGKVMGKEFTVAQFRGLNEQVDNVATSLKFVKNLRRIIVLGLAVFIGCTGARTGPDVPAEPAVTFNRVGEIFQATPFTSTPEGRLRIAGVIVESHAVHTSGDWVAFSTRDGLFVQDWRGFRTQLSNAQSIYAIDWTLDARRIAFSQNDRIWVVDLGGSGGATPLTRELTDPNGQRAMSPAWTPDGGRLYFIRYRVGMDS